MVELTQALMTDAELALMDGLNLSCAYGQSEKLVSLHIKSNEDRDAFVTAYIEYIQRRNGAALAG